MEVDAALWVLMAVAVAFVVCGCILTGPTKFHGLRGAGHS